MSYRLLTVHLAILNPHLKSKLDDLEALAEASIRKMGPHAAQLKANAAGFFDSGDFVKTYDRLLEGFCSM